MVVNWNFLGIMWVGGGGGMQNKKPFVGGGGGMDIFWNCTFQLVQLLFELKP